MKYSVRILAVWASISTTHQLIYRALTLIFLGRIQLIINPKGNNTLYKVPSVAVVVLSLLYGAICLLAILGNLLVLCLVILSLKL